jgi:hypothetical protein
MAITYHVGAVAAVTLMTAFFLPPARRAESGHVAPAAARDRNVQVMLELFRAIEERDPNHRDVERELSFYQPWCRVPLAACVAIRRNVSWSGPAQQPRLEHNMDAVAADAGRAQDGPFSDQCQRPSGRHPLSSARRETER